MLIRKFFGTLLNLHCGANLSQAKKITLVEDEKIINEAESKAEFVHLFFLNTDKNPKISECSNINPQAERISHPIFTAIL